MHVFILCKVETGRNLQNCFETLHNCLEFAQKRQESMRKGEGGGGEREEVTGCKRYRKQGGQTSIPPKLISLYSIY